MCGPKTVSLDFLNNLTRWRNDTQTIQFDLITCRDRPFSIESVSGHAAGFLSY